MEINLTAYGIGIGLVMTGWIAGLIVSYAFNITRMLGRIS